MSHDPDMTARHKALLGEFAELAMALARDLHAAALAAPEPEEKARLAQEFHRVGRSLRQTLALQARLDRAEGRELVEEVRRQREATREAVSVRRKKVRAAVERLIWTEAEGEEAEDYGLSLEELLDRAETDDDFLDAPLETLVARLAEDLGVTLPSAGLFNGAGPGFHPSQ